MPGAPARVVVRLPNWVGDIMMTLPALRAMRSVLPATDVLALARPEHVELARRIALIDHATGAPSRRGPGTWRAAWTVARKLRQAECEAAVLFAPSFEAALTVWLSGVPIRVGHATDHRGALLTDRVACRDGHRSDGFLDLVERLAGSGGRKDSGSTKGLICAPQERAWVDQLFDHLGFGRTTRPIFVNPAAAKTPRAWSSDRFQELTVRLASVSSCAVLVHARSPFEVPSDWAGHRSIRTVSDASLVELAAILERCEIYVGNDSGPMHIAAAVGIPTVGIYGPSSPSRTAPRGSRHTPVTAGFACSPCRERFFEECPSSSTADQRPPCLNAIDVDDVVAAVNDVLG